MARSMTGFGKAEFKNEKFEINVELRNLNNRYLDIGLRFPKMLAPYEFKIKEIIKSHVNRGKLSASIVYKDLSGIDSDFLVKEESVKSYYNLLEQIRKTTGVSGEITMDHLLSFKELWEPEEPAAEDAELEEKLYVVLKDALNSLNQMREEESENIKPDIVGRLNAINNALEEINELAKENPREELGKLYLRIKDLVSSGEVDRDRLELELALIADRVDVTEECTRLRSHIDMFNNVYSNNKEVGKKLTFILQEMQRESNTIGSKTSNVEISHKVIHIKEEIEKLREQVQNLE